MLLCGRNYANIAAGLGWSLDEALAAAAMIEGEILRRQINRRRTA